MKSFQILEHPSDVRVKAQGKNLPQLFQNAALGMMAVVRGRVSRLSGIPQKAGKSLPPQREKVKREIKAEGIDNETLLVNFLSEIWFQASTNRETYDKVEIINLKPNQISAILEGYPIERFELEIKAVTFWDLKIEEKEGFFETTVTFDI